MTLRPHSVGKKNAILQDLVSYHPLVSLCNIPFTGYEPAPRCRHKTVVVGGINLYTCGLDCMVKMDGHTIVERRDILLLLWKCFTWRLGIGLKSRQCSTSIGNRCMDTPVLQWNELQYFKLVVTVVTLGATTIAFTS